MLKGLKSNVLLIRPAKILINQSNWIIKKILLGEGSQSNSS